MSLTFVRGAEVTKKNSIGTASWVSQRGVTPRVCSRRDTLCKMARGNTFGLTSSRRARGGGGFRDWRGGRGRGRGRGGSNSNQPAPARGDDGTQTEERFENVKLNDEIDEKLGFKRISEGTRQEGWLVNMHPVSILFAGG